MTPPRSRPPTCPDENELVLLADGALADKRRASIDRHLDGCAPCTRLVAELAGMAVPVRVPSRYRIIRQLGAGAMGVVWEGEDAHLGRRVALKFVRTCEATASRTRDRRDRRARIQREARALARLRHPNVVTVYDVGESGDEMFLALELVIGMDARTWRAALPRTPDQILAVWRQAAAGLAAVHRAGIVHRDIKPDNILVADDGRVLVGDFGLATDHHHDKNATKRDARPMGTIVGTPLYMAYEQLLGEPASRKSDQYALCASLWEALLGERPFTGPTLGALAVAMQQPPAIPRRADRHVFVALARGLDPNPAKRWPDIDALLAALGGRVTAQPKRRRATWLALAAASVAAAATVGVLAWREHAAASRVAPAATNAVTAPDLGRDLGRRITPRTSPSVEPMPAPPPAAHEAAPLPVRAPSPKPAHEHAPIAPPPNGAPTTSVLPTPMRAELRDATPTERAPDVDERRDGARLPTDPDDD